MARVWVTPNPVPEGEQFKIEGNGFDLDAAALIAVDGDIIGEVVPHPSPDGGTIAFDWAINDVGTFEVKVSQALPKGGEGEQPGDVEGKEDVEVITGWPEQDDDDEEGGERVLAGGRR